MVKKDDDDEDDDKKDNDKHNNNQKIEDNVVNKKEEDEEEKEKEKEKVETKEQEQQPQQTLLVTPPTSQPVLVSKEQEQESNKSNITEPPPSQSTTTTTTITPTPVLVPTPTPTQTTIITTPTPTPTPTPVINKPTMMFPPRDIKEDTKKIWSRSFTLLPVGVDLPRLASCISVFNDQVDGSVDLANKGNVKKTILDILLALKEMFDGSENQEELEKIKANYENIPRNDDGSFNSKDLVEFLLKEFSENSPILQVLKVCNQSIIAPSVIELKLGICPKLMFKDAGGWMIKVELVDSDTVIVSHCKKQQHMDPRKEEEYFEFIWELEMIFNRDVSSLNQVTLSILSLTFGEKTRQDKKDEYLALFNSHMKVNK